MSWYRALLSVVTLILVLAPTLPFPPANPPFPTSPSPRTLNSSTLDLLASFDSLFNSISLGSRILNLDVPPSPRPYFTVLLAYKEAELANGAALIRHGASSALRVTEPLNLWSWSGFRIRRALRGTVSRFITPILDSIVHPSTTPTEKPDMAPTPAWTSTNPGLPHTAHSWTRGRTCTYDHDSASPSKGFPTVYDVLEVIRSWVYFVAAHLLAVGRVLFDYAEQAVTFGLDPSDQLAQLLSATIPVLDRLLRDLEQFQLSCISLARGVLVSVSLALSTAAYIGNDHLSSSPAYLSTVFDILPSWHQLVSTAEAHFSTSLSVARPIQVTVSNSLSLTPLMVKDHPLIVLLGLSWLVLGFAGLALLIVFGIISEERLLGYLGSDRTYIAREIIRLTDPRHRNVINLVLCLAFEYARRSTEANSSSSNDSGSGFSSDDLDDGSFDEELYGYQDYNFDDDYNPGYFNDSEDLDWEEHIGLEPPLASVPSMSFVSSTTSPFDGRPTQISAPRLLIDYPQSAAIPYEVSGQSMVSDARVRHPLVHMSVGRRRDVLALVSAYTDASVAEESRRLIDSANCFVYCAFRAVVLGNPVFRIAVLCLAAASLTPSANPAQPNKYQFEQPTTRREPPHVRPGAEVYRPRIMRDTEVSSEWRRQRHAEQEQALAEAEIRRQLASQQALEPSSRPSGRRRCRKRAGKQVKEREARQEEERLVQLVSEV